MACYLYGFAPADFEAPDAPGVAEAPVRGVPVDGLVAVVSEIDDAAVNTEGFEEAEASRHLDVLLAVLHGGPILPVAFGTVALDEDSLVNQIKPRVPVLRGELDRIHDLVEIDVTALDDEKSSVAAVVSAAPHQFRPGGDPLALGERVAAAVMEHRAHIADGVLARLREVAVDDRSRREVRSPEEPFLQWAFLIRRDVIDQFDDAVAELMESTPGLVLHSVGPLPPFSFVSTPPVDDPSSTSAAEESAATASGATDPFRSGNWGW